MSGVFGLFSKDGYRMKLAYSLGLANQHRGQEDAGVTVADPDGMATYKDWGLFSDVMNKHIMRLLKQTKDEYVIGHSGDNLTESIRHIDPFEIKDTVAISMEGKIVKKPKDYASNGMSDTEVVASMLQYELKDKNDLEKAVSSLMKELDGKAYYSAALLVNYDNETTLVGIHDAMGIKPFAMGWDDKSVAFSSETKGLDILKISQDNRHDVGFGKAIFVNDGEIEELQVLNPKPARCAFEYLYTASPDAVIGGITAYDVRKAMGRKLWERYEKTFDVVVGVPDSGRTVALGYAQASKLPFEEGLLKNSYVGRTYNIPDPEKRELRASDKHNPIRSIIEGKRVGVGDDSIVRGTITNAIGNTFRTIGGAKEVGYIISAAGLIAPCHTDEPDKYLAAREASKDGCTDPAELGRRVAEMINVEYVLYPSVKDVVNAIGLPECELCTMCMSGKNPFDR